MPKVVHHRLLILHAGEQQLMSDPSAPSELEKRSTETTASTPLKFSVLRLALAFVVAGGVGILPFWLLVVGAIAVLGTPRPKVGQR